MKKLLFLTLCSLALPVCAWQETVLEHALLTAPAEDPILSVYSTNKTVNSQGAVRLGYKNFRTRINTSGATATDTQIADLITTGFQPFFNKLNQLETKPAPERTALEAQYNQDFSQLVLQLAKLFIRNQHRYNAWMLLDESAAAEETAKIVQEAVENGSF